MRKKIKKQAGFTLVELLIVIIIIGILAGSMLLVAGSASEKAEAAKIVSNMRSLKTAALLYYADEAGKASEVVVPGTPSLDKYMDRKLADMGNEYQIIGAGNTWYIEYTFPAGFLKSVKKRIAAMKDAGIYDPSGKTPFNPEWHTAIRMKAR